MPLSHKPIMSVLIVAHNAMGDLPTLVKQLKRNTALPFDLFIWDNTSDDGTTEYLQGLSEGENVGVHITRTNVNEGFIFPNNRLYYQSACKSDAPYVCLLNTDIEVFEGWDTGLHSAFSIIASPGIAGYSGGLLDENGHGAGSGHGMDVDYIEGWCYFSKRSVIDSLGLPRHCIFNDEEQDFAYAEDSYTSLLAKEKGRNLCALWPMKQDGTPLIIHKRGQTTNKVVERQDGTTQRLAQSFDKNHEALRNRFADYLKHHRILAKRVES